MYIQDQSGEINGMTNLEGSIIELSASYFIVHGIMGVMYEICLKLDYQWDKR
jgi:hypothetical protein